MSYKSSSRITALGAYLPSRKLTNNDLEKMVDTNDEWIVRRTGVRERRISEENEFSSDMAIKAVENLIERNGASVDDVDMILVSTFTSDHLSPTVSALVQGHFGIMNTGSMDINSGCTGYAYALCVANSLITAGNCNKILVIASETVSKVVDYTNRSTCILFGDAAAAALVERDDRKGGFISSYFTTDGKLAENVACSNLSDSVNGVKLEKKRLFQQDGRFLYEYVVKNVPEGIRRLLDNAGLTLGDIDWIVPHSANLRMIESICKRLDYPIEKALVSNEFYGNTSSVTIPLAIWMALEKSMIKAGDKILLYGYGGGLTHGGIVIEW